MHLESTQYGSNIKYDNYKSCEEILTKQKNDIIKNNLTSQSLVIKSLWYETTNDMTKICHATIKNLSKNIFNFLNFISTTPHQIRRTC